MLVMQDSSSSHQRVPLSVEQCVREVVTVTECAVRRKTCCGSPQQVLVNYEIGEGVPARLLGDPLRLRQVLLDLCRNASQYTESGTITVSVQVAPKSVGKRARVPDHSSQPTSPKRRMEAEGVCQNVLPKKALPASAFEDAGEWSDEDEVEIVASSFCDDISSDDDDSVAAFSTASRLSEIDVLESQVSVIMSGRGSSSQPPSPAQRSLGVPSYANSPRQNALSPPDRGSVGSAASSPITLEFRVIDTGIGIDAERLPKLFAMELNGQQSGRPAVGLWMAKRMVTAMNGEIAVQSTRGKGSTFSFTTTFYSQPANQHVPRPSPRWNERRSSLPDLNRPFGVPLPSPTSGVQVAAVNFAPQFGRASSRNTYDHAPNDDPFLCPHAAPPPQLLRSVSEPTSYRLQLTTQTTPAPSPTDVPIVAQKQDHLLNPITLAPEPEVTLRFRAPHSTLCAVPEHPNNPLSQLPIENAQHERGESTGRAAFNMPSPAMSEPNRKLHVLIAEDNCLLQRMLQKALAKRGYIADCADDGLAAVKKVEKRDYDIIFMDVKMPEMDGLEATRRIRKLCSIQGRVYPFIVALTALSTAKERETCEAAGMDLHLTKPVKVNDMLRAVELAEQRCEPRLFCLNEPSPAARSDAGHAPLDALRLPPRKNTDASKTYSLRGNENLPPRPSPRPGRSSRRTPLQTGTGS